MSRVLTALAALLLMTAFAPAPFPRTTRTPEGLSVQTVQANWTVVRKESISNGTKSIYNSGISHIRIEGDRWILMNNGKHLATYRIVIDGTKRPGTIDWYPAEKSERKQNTLWVGAVKREGDYLLVMYGGSRPQNKPVTFEDPPSGWYLYTMKR